MPTKRNLADLKTRAEKWPNGPAAFILARGKIEGDDVLVDDALQKELEEKFPPVPPSPILRHQGLPPLPRGHYRVAPLQANPGKFPAGYAEFILERGKIEGDLIILDEAAQKEFREKFPPRVIGPPPRVPPPAPTLTELATNFSGAMADWAGAGFKTVEKEEYERRQAICLACEFWLPHAMLGLGKCKKCGCSKFKLWLATSQCPDKPPRW